MSLTTRASLICLCVFAYPAVSFGMFIGSNDGTLPGSADGANITLDTTTGLEWLDVDATIGRTVADVKSNLTATGDLAGLRYATEDEIKALFVAAGIAVTNWPAFTISGGDGPLVDALVAFVGQTLTNVIFNGAIGYTGVEAGGLYNFAELINQNQGGVGASEVGIAADSNASTGSRGHWLVREAQAVSEPSSILLLGLGLAVGLAGRRRNRRNRVV